MNREHPLQLPALGDRHDPLHKQHRHPPPTATTLQDARFHPAGRSHRCYTITIIVIITIAPSIWTFMRVRVRVWSNFDNVLQPPPTMERNAVRRQRPSSPPPLS